MKPVAHKFIKVFNNTPEECMSTYEDHVEYALDIAIDEAFVVLQSIASGISSNPRHDATILLRKMDGYLEGYGD